MIETKKSKIIFGFACLLFLITNAEFLPSGKLNADDFKKTVKPFFQAHCIKCHGAGKSKASITLHDIDGDVVTGKDQSRWEQVLDVLKSGEMPPENASVQPSQTDLDHVAEWIDAGLRKSLLASGSSLTPTTRRLTNFEYENTIRDLIGFKIKLVDNLPKDPVKPYTFNNTAEFMRMGPEQIDRYLENARRVMTSAIVDPVKPKSNKIRRQWKPHGIDKGLGGDEIGPWGNRRNTPSWGMGLTSFPKTGEFRIRMKAAAILPPGITELPLRLVMGYGINVNSSTQQIEPVGTVRLRNTLDEPKVFELRGRIENFPFQPSKTVKNKRQPESFTITPQNLYDDGSLNDERRPLAMPRAVIEWMEFEAPISDAWPPEHHTRILFESPLRESDPSAYVRQVITRFVSRAYRRPATEMEVGRFVKIYDLVSLELDSFEAAMRETLAMVLVSPNFLFHSRDESATTKQQYTLASKLSYFLWGSMPDTELIRLAADGKLDDSSEIQRQVKRLLEDEKSHDFVNNFTSQWLSLGKLKTVPINRELFPRFLYYVPRGERAGTEEPYRPTIRDYMLEETIGFVGELIRRNASVLNIIDSDFAFLNQPLAAHYGVDGVQGDQLRPVQLKPTHQLGGLLTQGSILVGNGTGSAPHPIYRAVWLREAILGDEVPAPPADVPALSDTAGESADNALTIKDLLVQHRQKESCNDCHARLDPWGVPFEQYNAIGRFQPKVPKAGVRVSGFNKMQHQDLNGYQKYLQSINTIDVQADADLPRGPKVDGLADLKKYLLAERKDEVARNVLQRLLSYGLGRKLTYHDRFAVEEMVQQSNERGNKLQDMIVIISQSKLFRSND